MPLSDAHHSRKMVAGACMVVAPVVLPAGDMDEATQVATIADNLDAWYVAHLLALVAIAVMVPALLGLACLAAGLYRARAVQSWMAFSVAAGAILFGFGFATTM